MGLLFLRGYRRTGALTYSFAVSVKMQPLLYAPAVGLCMVLQGGWSETILLLALMATLQVGIALPFLQANPVAYLSRAFGGPGDLQQVWSVNWNWLPERLFYDQAFVVCLLCLHLVVLLWFAQKRWTLAGLFHETVWRWSGTHAPLDKSAVVCTWFACNFVGICFLRTVHFQFISWYLPTLPFLAWYAIRPEKSRGLAWAVRCAVVVLLVLAVEIPYILTTRGVVRGPDGSSWETEGVPTRKGGILFFAAHFVLLALLAAAPAVYTPGKREHEKTQ